MSKDRDDFDANEWGNIGPDSMHDTKWNLKWTKAEKERQSLVAKNLWKDETYRKGWQERWSDPAFLKAIGDDRKQWINDNYEYWYEKTLEGHAKSVVTKHEKGIYKKFGKELKVNAKYIKSMTTVHKNLKNSGHYDKLAKQNSRPIIAEGIEYKSITEAAAAFNITVATMYERIHRNTDFYYYVDEGPTPVYIWFYITPAGKFTGADDAAIANNISAHIVKTSILKGIEGWDYKKLIRSSWEQKNSSLWKKGIKYKEGTNED